jgi:transcriptional regulator with GAF, ATPase, and Fis domain
MVAAREALLSATFVELADTLVDEFDIIELLTMLSDRCVALLDAGATAIMVADPQGVLHVMAASSEQAHLLELFQLQNREGPCLECYLSGQPVINEDLATSQRWPRFRTEALAAGFRSVQALPLRLRELTIGALNVFVDDRTALNNADLVVAQALADAATISILHDQAARHARVVTAQLQGALTSRVIIEQAKGILAERANIDTDQAFDRLRRYARDHNLGLGALARQLVNTTLTPTAMHALTNPPPPTRPPDLANSPGGE